VSVLRGAHAALLGFVFSYLVSLVLLRWADSENAGGLALWIALASAGGAIIASVLALAPQFTLRFRRRRKAASDVAEPLPAAKRSGLAAGTGIALLLGITIPLYAEFFEPRDYLWDAFLALFLVGVVIAALRLARFFASHAGELGEARFDTRNEGDLRG
jgi:MFS family permease